MTEESRPRRKKKRRPVEQAQPGVRRKKKKKRPPVAETVSAAVSAKLYEKVKDVERAETKQVRPKKSYPAVQDQPLPFSRGRLQTLMTQLVGRRQSLYTLLEELRDRRCLQPVESTEHRRAVFDIFARLHTEMCEAEQALAAFIKQLYPDFEFPHGTGFTAPPVTLTFEPLDGPYYAQDHKGNDG